MKTPKNFDYDLWVTEDGKCMVRVKSTGEVTEIDRSVMRFLRAEEKRLRREMEEQENGNTLFLEIQPNDETGESWLVDTYDFQSELMSEITKSEFCNLLTPKQLDVFQKCLMGGKSLTQYALENGVSIPVIHRRIGAIRKKAKKFFDEG